MKPDYNERDLAVIEALSRYFAGKDAAAFAKDYYLLARSVSDAAIYMERGNFQMARRIITEGGELAEKTFAEAGCSEYDGGGNP